MAQFINFINFEMSALINLLHLLLSDLTISLCKHDPIISPLNTQDVPTNQKESANLKIENKVTVLETNTKY